MRFDLHKPCADCPFRCDGAGITLTKARIREIGRMMLSPDSDTFTCHKTVGAGPESQHCGGALLFAERQGNATQAMRIAERLRIYDPRRTRDSKVLALVWPSLKAWLDGGSTR